MKKIKIIHLPTTVGGNPQRLSRHLSQLGFHSESWTLHQNYFGYPADRVLISETDNNFWGELKKLYAFRYVFQFDVVFFNFGRTLFRPISTAHREGQPLWKELLLRIYTSYAACMQNLELALLCKRKVPLFVQYQGDDARQGDYCLDNFTITAATRVESTYYTAESDSLKRKQIKKITSVCKKCYALNPDLLYVLPSNAEFLPYSHISLDDWLPLYTQLEDRPLRIGHAPSHRAGKGTDLVLAARDRLKKRGYRFEFVLIEGLSNKDAKECYKTLDVLVDQLFFGWYGGIAVEAMALGKPVLVYIRERDLKFIPEPMQRDLPVVNVTPDTIEAGLQKVLDMPRSELLDLAKKSRAYVERWHDPVAIAQRIKRDIEEAIGRAHA